MNTYLESSSVDGQLQEKENVDDPEKLKQGIRERTDPTIKLWSGNRADC